MKNSQENIFKSLAFEFANNKNEWNRLTSVFATKFLTSYLDNIYIMNIKLKEINQKEEGYIFSNQDRMNVTLINDYIFLKTCIKIDKNTNEVIVDLKKINRNYFKIGSMIEITEIKNAIAQMEGTIKTIAGSKRKHNLYDLNDSYNNLIAYVKYPKSREDFFYKYLLPQAKIETYAIQPKIFNSKYCYNFA